MTNFEVAKVFTIVDPRKNIPEAVNVQFDKGEVHRIRVFLPWLPPMCSHCQELGHSIKHCPIGLVSCLACKLTAHDRIFCLQSKKNIKTGPRNVTNSKRRNKRSITIPFAPLDNSASTSKQPRQSKDKKKFPIQTGGALVLDIGLNYLHKQSENQVKTVQGKGKDKAVASPSGFVLLRQGQTPLQMARLQIPQTVQMKIQRMSERRYLLRSFLKNRDA
ncbi:hypothetical protein V5N11_030930 [Cardamine amara subsp. amara]|uniref:Zinc knuckle CX2CX4HX4C domain-containing protein n=1 Tax=Cardamine amara subsp. amara TaxID=228776 RepID=A0ABD1BLA4_CARAN